MGTNSRKPSGSKSRSAHRDILNSIDSRIHSAFPEDEMEKWNKAMLLVFGPEPDRFVVPEKYRHLDD